MDVIIVFARATAAKLYPDRGRAHPNCFTPPKKGHQLHDLRVLGEKTTCHSPYADLNAVNGSDSY